MKFSFRASCILFIMLFVAGVSSAQQSSVVDSLISLLKSSKDTAKIRILNSLSFHYFEKVPEKAIDYGKQALSLSQELNIKQGQARAYLNIGRGYYAKSDYTKAQSFVSEALRLFKDTKDNTGIADAFIAAASVYTDLGNYENALNYNLQALTIREENNDSSALSSSLINVGLIYYKLGKMKLANDYYRRSLDIRMKLNDQNGISACYNNMANVYDDQGDHEKALEYLNKSLQIKEKLGNKKGIASALNNIGSVYNSLENYSKAKEYYLRSLALKREINDQMGIANTLGNIGAIYYFTNDKKEAIGYFLQAIDAAKQIGASDVILTNYRNVAQTYFENGEHKSASEYFMLASDLKDSIYNVEGAKSMNEMQAKFDFEKQEKELKISRQNAQIQALDANKQRLFKNAFIIGFILLLIIAFVIYNRYQIKRRANTELELQKQEITRQHKDITDSIKYAKRIQVAFLPTADFENEFGDRAFVLYKPKDIVSGDFYWMERKGKELLLAAVDCTGHGVPGAFMSIVGFNLLNQAVNEHKITRPSEILDELNAGVTDTLRQYESESTVKDGMDIALCNINFDTLQLQYAGAFNSLWVVRNNELIEISANKFPIGTFVGETLRKFDNQTFQLQKGDCVYMYTDGYADQFGGPQGKKFKYKQFHQILKENSKKSAAEQKEALIAAYEAWAGKLEQIDDILIIGLII